jgi:hypothetical protein
MATKKKAKGKVVKKMSTKAEKVQPEVYIDNDTVLPTLDLPAVTPITVRFNKDIVTLTVGPRDWEWDRKTKKLNGTGVLSFPDPIQEEEVITTEVNTQGESAVDELADQDLEGKIDSTLKNEGE